MKDGDIVAGGPEVLLHRATRSPTKSWGMSGHPCTTSGPKWPADWLSSQHGAHGIPYPISARHCWPTLRGRLHRPQIRHSDTPASSQKGISCWHVQFHMRLACRTFDRSSHQALILSWVSSALLLCLLRAVWHSRSQAELKRRLQRTWGMVGHCEKALISSLTPGLYTSSRTLTTS